MADQPEVDVTSLRAALDRANARNQELTTAVADRDRKLTTEVAGRITAEEAAVDNAITAKESERDTLKAEYARLNAEGDFARAADVQYQMAEVAADLRDYGKQKTAFASARETARANPPPAAADAPQVPAARKAWFDSHPQFFTDKKYNAKAMALHADAVAKDIVVDSADYFRFIDDGLSDGGHVAQPRRAAEAADDGGAAEQEITVDSPRSQPTTAIPANAAPEKPQGRAAGPGSFAAAPSRRAAPTPAERRTTSLTPDQADSALRLAASLKPELRSQADIYKWYADLMDTQSVRARLSGAA